MKKITKFIAALAATAALGVFIPSLVSAQVFSQNQIIQPASLGDGFLVSTSTATGAKLSAQSISITSPFLTGILPISSGGLGTSTAPGNGKLLIGDASGNYEFIATSSLGIVSGVSSFNTRTGAITLSSGDVTTALGYTPSNFAYPFPSNATSTALTFSSGLNVDALLDIKNSSGFNGVRVENSSNANVLDIFNDGDPHIESTAGSTLWLNQDSGAQVDLGGVFDVNTTGVNSSVPFSISGTSDGCATFSGSVLGSTGTACGSGSGGVTSVTGAYPVISSGGTTPVISLAFGTTTSNTWAGTQTFTNQIAAPGGLTSNAQLNLVYSGPAILMQNTGATTDNKNWVMGAGATDFSIYALNDAGSASAKLISATRSGATITAIALPSLTSNGLVKTSGGAGTLSIATAGTDYLVPASALTTGSVLFANSSGQVAQDNTNFFWDATNHRLGIGTTTPQTALHIVSSANDGAMIQNLTGTATNLDLATGDVLSGTESAYFKFGINNSGNFQIRDAKNLKTPFVLEANAPANALYVAATGNVGISSSTPGSLLSVGSTNGINFSTATSTFSSTGGINLTSGCFAIGGVCIGAGGTYTAGTGLTLTGGAFSVNTSQNISTLSNLSTAGFVKTNASGLLSVDTNTYLTGNQTITLSGAVSGSGTTAITTSYAGIVPSTLGGAGSVSGILKANGSGTVTAAAAGTDYLAPTGSGAALTGIPTSVSNSDSTLTISPTTGAVVASLNLAHANTWSALQTFNAAASTTNTSASGQFFGANSSTAAAPTYGFTNTSGTGMYSPSAAIVRISTAGNDIANLSASGFTSLISGTAGVPGLSVGSANSGFFTPGTGILGFSTSGTERMRIIANGLIGIGTTTPAGAQLVIASSTASQLSITDGSLTSNQWNFRNAGGTLYMGTSSPVTNATNTPSAISLTSSAATHIGFATTTTTWTFATNGTVAMAGLTTGAGTVHGVCIDATTHQLEENTSASCTVSSKRFKHSIEPLDVNGITDVMAMKPDSFIYNEDASNTVMYGFIAEDMAAIDPQLVGYDASGTVNSIDDIGVQAIVVKAIQEQQAQISALSGKGVKDAEDNWQWFAIIALGLALGYQQWQIRKMRV